MVLKYPTTSKTLLDKIASGDEISWDEFFRRYKGVILAVARYKGLSEEDADDILQAVMLDFFKQSRSFRFDPDLARFRTYFGQIVRARIADFYRASGKQKKIADYILQQGPESSEDEGMDAAFMTEWRKAVFSDACAKLRERVSPDTWQAFEMYAVQGRPVEKVAAYLDYSVNQVYQAKKRCVAILRKTISELNARDPELRLDQLHHEL